jgi:hypothetical protein
MTCGVSWRTPCARVALAITPPTFVELNKGEGLSTHTTEVKLYEACMSGRVAVGSKRASAASRRQW